MPEPALREPSAAPHPRHPKDSSGLTVLEILVALAILIVALGAIYGVVRHTVASFGLSEDLLDAQQHARLGLERLVEEARWARRVVAAGTSQLELEIAPDNPRAPGCTYTVRFEHDASRRTFDRSVVSASGPCPPAVGAESIASFVTRVAYTYCDATGVCGASVPLNAIVRVEAEIEVTKGLGPLPQRRSVSGAVLLRNVRAAGVTTPTPPLVTAPWRPTPGQMVLPPPSPNPTITATVALPTATRTATPTPAPTPPRTATPTPAPTPAPTVWLPTPTWTPPRPR